MNPLYLFYILFTILIIGCRDSADHIAQEWDVLSYPQRIVSSFEESGLSEMELLARASAQLPEYVQSAGYDDVAGVILSPHYSAKVNGRDIPTYSSMVFNRTKNIGALHSFSEIYVDTAEDISLEIELQSLTEQPDNVLILPSSYGVEAVCEDGIVQATIGQTGIYTFLFNSTGQEKGFTLFV